MCLCSMLSVSTSISSRSVRGAVPVTLKLPVLVDGHGPLELIAEGLSEDLVQRDFMLLAPCSRDTRVNVVDLGCTQRCLLVLLLIITIKTIIG